jgi:hypothetical protein
VPRLPCPLHVLVSAMSSSLPGGAGSVPQRVRSQEIYVVIKATGRPAPHQHRRRQHLGNIHRPITEFTVSRRDAARFADLT